MEADTRKDDVQAIEAIIARQFASLSWAPGASADWDGFAADFFPRRRSIQPPAQPNARRSRHSSNG